jgi:uncharacterized protein YmfQ (DUF2313 family)
MANLFAQLGSADFLSAIQKRLPRGAAWPRGSAAVLTQYFGAIADCVADLHARAADLSERESDIAQTIELLPEWEAQYGLPDPCTPAGATIQQRQAALVAKEAQQGGQSAAYFIAVASALGFTITISTFAVAQIGISTIGQPMNGTPWRFAWQINAPLNTVTPARIGLSSIGEPLAAWGNATLECRMRQIMPAETWLIFSYT